MGAVQPVAVLLGTRPSNRPPDPVRTARQVTQVTLPSYGDESSAVTMNATVPGSGLHTSQGLTVVRCESIVVRVVISDDNGSTVDLDALNAFTRTVTARAQQALDNTTPTAAVELQRHAPWPPSAPAARPRSRHPPPPSSSPSTSSKPAGPNC
ncbi:hypothetical protein ACFVYT_38880 [Streptomyces sp. NPDC058290]|uniref:hypothetical protein n=1 Tax=Streptomyces sp. NPDC058290 TaxID=3346426 RepID=UPI0036F0569C